MPKLPWFMFLFTILVVQGAPSASTAGDCKEPIPLIDTKQGSCKKDEAELKCGCLTKPKITKKVDPYFPAAARGLGITGHVSLIAIINPDGKIGEIEIVKASPEKRGFEAAAIDAVKKWRYRPAMLGGKAVAVSFIVNMDFHFR